MSPEKYDIKRALRELYAPPVGRFVVLDVPDQQFLAVDGHGDPNTSPSYAAAVQALYAASYGVKFASKAEGRDFVVGPLEGLWHADDMAAFTARDKAVWRWTMLVAQPPWVADALVEAAVSGSVRRLTMSEGRCVQTLHIGSYDDEGPVLDRLHHEYMPSSGLAFGGLHHEIYLSDPRRTPAERRRTVLRQPVVDL